MPWTLPTALWALLLAQAAVDSSARVEVARRVAEPRQAAVVHTEVLDAAVLLSRGVRDVGDALATLPGVQVVETVDGRRVLMLDGFVARALWCVDGWPVPRAPDGLVDLGELPVGVDSLQRVEVVRQPMAHIYGSGAEGGVINLVTRRLQRTTASATFGARAFHSGALEAQGGGAASYAGERGGVYANGAVLGAPTQDGAPFVGDRAGRRVVGAAAGGAFRLHPRVVMRTDAHARELTVNAPGETLAARTRRIGALAEAVVALTAQDTVRVELRASGVERLAGAWNPGAGAQRAVEQAAVLRYLGEPLGGHQVQAELLLTGEWAEDNAGGWPVTLARQRLRAAILLGDTWRVSRVFALEGAVRVETSDRLSPAWAPALSFRWEPFRHVFVRGTVAAGYRYTPLLAAAQTFPEPLSVLPKPQSDHDSSRSARLGITLDPGNGVRATAEFFRLDMAAAPLAFQTGGLALGVTLGQFQQPFSASAHVQGVRLDGALFHARGGVTVAGGYVYLQEALDDVTGARLPLAPRHAGSMRLLWMPDFLAGGAEAGLEFRVDRVDAAGNTLPHQTTLHVGVRKKLGPVDVSCAVFNGLNAVDVDAGVRDGRSARCVVHAGL